MKHKRVPSMAGRIVVCMVAAMLSFSFQSFPAKGEGIWASPSEAQPVATATDAQRGEAGENEAEEEEENTGTEEVHTAVASASDACAASPSDACPASPSDAGEREDADLRSEIQDAIWALPTIAQLEADESHLLLYETYWRIMEIFSWIDMESDYLLVYDSETGYYDGLEGIDAWKLYELSGYVFAAYEELSRTGAFEAMETASASAASAATLAGVASVSQLTGQDEVYFLPKTGAGGVRSGFALGLSLFYAPLFIYPLKKKEEKNETGNQEER